MATPHWRKALGQHFLRDQGVIHQIVDRFKQESTETNCDTWLEIGPGKGALTHPLLKTREGHPFFLCERDKRLLEYWESWTQETKELPETGTIHLLPGDFLDLPSENWLQGKKLGVISNLPYSAGTAILSQLAAYPDRIGAMVLMFQTEVAERIRAQLPPHTENVKKLGSLTLWIQNWWRVDKLLSVRPGAFSPPPEVTSEVLVFRPRLAKDYPMAVSPRSPEADLWQKLLLAAFAHRRKMLRSGLPPAFRSALERSGVDGTKRAEALTWDEWNRLWQACHGPGN